MTTKMDKIVTDEKSTKRFNEKAELHHDVKPNVLENADYTGAEAKTDPEEIRLVRKIDWRLMVCTYESKTEDSATAL